MNLPLREFWRRVREVESTLPSDVWLAPAEGGNLTQTPRSIAAEALVLGSHRLAEPNEVAAYKRVVSIRAGEFVATADRDRRMGGLYLGGTRV